MSVADGNAGYLPSLFPVSVLIEPTDHIDLSARSIAAPPSTIAAGCYGSSVRIFLVLFSPFASQTYLAYLIGVVHRQTFAGSVIQYLAPGWVAYWARDVESRSITPLVNLQPLPIRYLRPSACHIVSLANTAICRLLDVLGCRCGDELDGCFLRIDLGNDEISFPSLFTLPTDTAIFGICLDSRSRPFSDAPPPLPLPLCPHPPPYIAALPCLPTYACPSLALHCCTAPITTQVDDGIVRIWDERSTGGTMASFHAWYDSDFVGGEGRVKVSGLDWYSRPGAGRGGRGMLGYLKARRDVTAARANKIRTALAPHKELPPELLREIFLHSLDGRPFVLPVRSEQNGPWPLRSVSSRWRKLAVSEYRLWSDISVRLRKWDSDLHDRLVHAIVEICSPADYSRGPTKMDIDVSEDIGATLAEPSPLKLLSKFLPCLREVSLSFPSKYSDHFTKGLSGRFFCNAVDLRRLKINCTGSAMIMTGGLAMLGEAPGIPWAQMTGLCLSMVYQSVESAMQILRLCPHLEACTISLLNLTAIPIVEMLTLPHLKSLTINEAPSSENGILNNLVAPSLVELRLFFVQLGSFSEILSFLHHSSASLEVFWCNKLLSYKYLYQMPGVEDFLEQVPTLLEFQAPNLFPMSVLQRVLHGELLPRLEIWRCGLLHDTVDAFIDAVEARLMPEMGASHVLHKVCGCIAIESGTAELRGPLQRLEKIREQYQGDFTLVDSDGRSLS
ncbi:hypothetical protein Hypma_012082 [Hypsizygus marmoreus]|uniref:F-box domain-containing protein n=1 Tax=Hypsizygus marmoreus TaxID=39966 RepID=A0A369JHS8_HYPMA|nr:hypothetical protein Hypma_012082 [Hypsizygus marmoreus]